MAFAALREILPNPDWLVKLALGPVRESPSSFDGNTPHPAPPGQAPTPVNQFTAPAPAMPYEFRPLMAIPPGTIPPAPTQSDSHNRNLTRIPLT